MKLNLKSAAIVIAGLASCALYGPRLWAQGFHAGNKAKPQESSHYQVQAPRYPDMGVGVSLGWESTYGNAVTYHWLPAYNWDLHGGLGYNSSGMKLGAGFSNLWYFTRSFGLRSGLSLVYSAGSSGEIAIDAHFTPEGSTKDEDISASKTYEVSSAMMGNIAVGGFWAITRTIHLLLEGTYNSILSGNEVTLADRIQYSRNIQATNQYEFEQDFDEKAKDKAEAGGLGFNLGMIFLW